MKTFILLVILLVVVSVFCNDSDRRQRGTIRTEKSEKTLKTNGGCVRVAYKLETSDADPNARPICTMTQCTTKVSERVPCSIYFPDKIQ